MSGSELKDGLMSLFGVRMPLWFAGVLWTAAAAAGGMIWHASSGLATYDNQIANLQEHDRQTDRRLETLEKSMVDVDRRFNENTARISELVRARDTSDNALALRLSLIEAQAQWSAAHPTVGAKR